MSERQVLELLFSSLQGGGWSVKTNWMTDSPICSWYGILCDYDNVDVANSDEHKGEEGVIAIDLPNNNMIGALPYHVLWGMPMLQTLNLKGNTELEAPLYHGASKKDSNVKRLLLSRCYVENLNGIERLPKLRELSVSGLKGMATSCTTATNHCFLGELG